MRSHFWVNSYNLYRLGSFSIILNVAVSVDIAFILNSWTNIREFRQWARLKTYTAKLKVENRHITRMAKREEFEVQPSPPTRTKKTPTHLVKTMLPVLPCMFPPDFYCL